MLFENLEISGSLKGQGITKPPSGGPSGRPSSPETGSLYLQESSLNVGWADYGGNTANYNILNNDSIIIRNTSTGWIGYFYGNASPVGRYLLRFTYYTDSGTSSLVVDNDGIDDNTFNTTLTATMDPQTHYSTVTTTAEGQIRMFLRHNGGGGNITITNFRMVLESDANKSYLMVYTGVGNNDSGWERISQQSNFGQTAYKYRSIINYSYLAGGYKSSSPWRNVHKTINATDQTSHLGELLDYPASYTSGACSRFIFFVWSVNTSGAFMGPASVNSTYTSAINMWNDTNYTHNAKFDLANSRSDLGTLFKEQTYAYVFAGGTTTMEIFDLINETVLTRTLSSSDSGDGASAFSDEHYGYGWGSFGGFKFNFATESQTSSTMWGAHGQQKGISSKVGKGYAGNEGSYAGGYNLRRWSNQTDTNLGNVAKPHPNCGEENFTMGQDWQYMLGNYDGAQNNTSWKFNYSTDTGTVNPSGLAPGVNAGTSSGHCGWRD